MKLIVFDLTGENCLTLDDGQKVYNFIHPELLAGRQVELDFDMEQPFTSTGSYYNIPVYPIPTSVHYLKAETEYYQATEKGLKMFEVRKNDKNYQVGDTVHLQEVVQDIPTKRVLTLEIIYVLKGGHDGGEGLVKDYCILQLKNKLPVGYKQI